MDPFKELLLMCVLVVRAPASASSPIKLMSLVAEWSLPNLRWAESEYVAKIFHGDKPMKYVLESLEPIQGIAFPAGNNSANILPSACAVADYLDNLLPQIIRNVTLQHHDLISNVKLFAGQFKAAVEQSGKCEKAQMSVPQTDAYGEKETGLRIIYFSRRWVESLIRSVS